MENKLRLILASGSLQRKQIFDDIGFKYEIIKSNAEELSNAVDPSKYVMDLSKGKADAVSKIVSKNAIIVAADTIIYFDGKIYEKPKSKGEAFANLKKMSGNTTHAVTGVTIKDLYTGREIQFADQVEVKFREIADDDIVWYVENEKRLFNICGYAIKGKASLFLEKVVGDYNVLLGISPSSLLEKFKELGYKISDFEFIE